MKKVFAIVLSACLVLLCLAGCGGGSVKASVTDIADTLKTTAAVENPMAIDDDEMNYNMGMTMDNIDSYAGYYTGVTGHSGTVVAIKAKSGKVNDVKTELETYRAKNADFLSNYPEFATAKTQAENGRVVAKGDVVVLVIAADGVDYSAVDSAIETALQ